MSHMKKAAQRNPLRSNPQDTVDHITDHWMFLELKKRQSSLVLTYRTFLSPAFTFLPLEQMFELRLLFPTFSLFFSPTEQTAIVAILLLT